MAGKLKPLQGSSRFIDGGGKGGHVYEGADSLQHEKKYFDRYTRPT